jgi:hypothetical protein
MTFLTFTQFTFVRDERRKKIYEEIAGFELGGKSST